MFEGTIRISPNPIATVGDRYTKTFSPVFISGKEGYRGFTKEERADGGFWGCRFLLTGSKLFLEDFMSTSLSRQINVDDEHNQALWEGMIFEMQLNTGVGLFRTSLMDMYNRVWIRYRVTGAGATTVSTPLENLASQARYGIREYILTGGELENASVADQPVQQFLDRHHVPKVTPVQLGLAGRGAEATVQGVTDRPHIEVTCRGFIDTLGWQVYSNAVAGNQVANQQVQDILDSGKCQFISGYRIGANATLVSTKYDTDRRSGGIIRDIARLGGAGNDRYITWVDFNRIFVYELASPSASV